MYLKKWRSWEDYNVEKFLMLDMVYNYIVQEKDMFSSLNANELAICTPHIPLLRHVHIPTTLYISLHILKIYFLSFNPTVLCRYIDHI